MASRRRYAVYIRSSDTRALYIGVTRDLAKRLAEHRAGVKAVYTSRHRIHRLVYFEHFDQIVVAIAREKQLKRWRRSKKVWLIESMNPTWSSLDSAIASRLLRSG
jgi:putative endonuclease